MISNKNILITGGAGFIGGSLANFLKDRNQVIIVDDLSNPSENFQKDRFKFYNISAGEIGGLAAKPFDYVFHFGEYSRVEQSIGKFNYVFEKNTEQLPKVLDFCKTTGAKLVYAGSSTRFADDVNCKMLSPYTLTKAINCEIISSYSKWYGIDHVICYFSNVYGPGECSNADYQTVVEKFLNLKISGTNALPVVGDGNQVREFTHILDTVEGILLAAEKGYGDNYCITSGKRYSILDLVKLMGGQPEFRPDNPANRKSTSIDASKLHLLGWRPRHNLSDYINHRLKEL